MSTLRGVLHKNGIQSYGAVTKPFLSSRNVKARIQWARRHESYTEEQWVTVIFSDETSVTLRPKTQHKKVWRMKGDRYNSSNLVPSFKSGYVSISVWAAFSTRGRTPLVLID